MKPTIYTVATTHLDTSWSWTLETTIGEYLPKTVRDNAELFKKYPGYRFSFEGSYRYELLEEYYPELFEQVKGYIADGRWAVAGSSFENGDVNIPSPEALFRNILYGNGYFMEKFGKRSADIYLPDCFGFGWALPSVAAHSGLLGFTTQKLCWSCAYGIPFDFGFWEGPDGSRIYMSPDGRDYNGSLKCVRRNPKVRGSLEYNKRKYGLPVSMILHGIGDRGGAPREKSVRTVAAEAEKNSDSKIDVKAAFTDEIFRDVEKNLTEEQKNRLPVWKNELVMTDHGVGGYTSRTASKRFNRRAEQLADAAERMNVFADLYASHEYPRQTFDTAWKRVIAHQFHDDIPGTSLAECYDRNWNDYILSLNQFAEEYRAGVGALSKLADTSFVRGNAVMVTNPLQYERTGCVSVRITLPDGSDAAVYDAQGCQVPSQIKHSSGTAEVTFCAAVPAFGFSVYDIRSGEKCTAQTALCVSDRSLENERYSVSFDENGDICGIYDKKLKKELLRAPVRLGLYDYNGFAPYPAWELDFKEVSASPAEYAGDPEFYIEENGPARVTIKTVRRARNSVFEMYISLETGGEYVSVFNEIEWRSLRTLLKTEFPLAAQNDKAVYDLGLGVIERGVNTKRLYEVPAQNFAAVRDRSGSFSTAVFSDSRCGWDRPDKNTLRLTGMHSPLAAYRDAQHLLDFGKNRYSFAVCGVDGNSLAQIQRRSAEFMQPLAAFNVSASGGSLGSSFSFMKVEGNAVVRALKKAQSGDELVLRVNECEGKSGKVSVQIGTAICSARAILASEEPCGREDFSVSDGVLTFGLKPFEVRSFALKTENSTKTAGNVCVPIELDCNYTEAVPNGGYAGHETAPLELLPERISCGGVEFFPDRRGLAMSCCGQTLKLPANADRLHILAARAGSDSPTQIKLGDKTCVFTVLSETERPGAWDNYYMGHTGYIKPGTLGWCFTHSHGEKGDIIAKQRYFFKYSFDIENGMDSVILPEDESIIILAATATLNENKCETAFPMFDELEKREFDFQLSDEDERRAHNAKKEGIRGRCKFVRNYAVRRLKTELKQRFG